MDENVKNDAKQVMLVQNADDGRQYYDGNGNHVYYDRRLIARPEKEKEEELQENNH